MNTRFININQERIAYIDQGKCEKTLLFLHGAMINKAYWREQINYFSAMYRVIAVDFAGHGESTALVDDWSIQRYAQDISHLIEQLCLRNVILVAHSFSADVALEVTHKNSEQIMQIIDVDHFKQLDESMPQSAIDSITQALKSNFTQTCEAYAKQNLYSDSTDPKLIHALLNDIGKVSPTIAIPLLAANFAFTPRRLKLLSGLKVKLQLLHSNYSPTNLNALKKYVIQEIRFAEIASFSHYPMLECPRRFNDLLLRLITDNKP